jgi:hypothetical protein
MKDEIKIEVVPGIFYTPPVSTPVKPIEILFGNLPKAEQYWRRQNDFPQFFFDYNPHLPDNKVCRINASKTEYKSNKLVTLSVEDTIELDRLVKREVDRMKNGIYVMIEGKKEYWPGPYYGALQWGKMFGVSANKGYGDHWEYQQIFACAREFCIKEDFLDGYYCHKPKKVGITQLVALFHMVEMITHRQFTTAAMSKAHETAKKANYKYFLYGFKNLPFVLRPMTEQKSWQNSVQKLELKVEDNEFSLENTFAAVPTTKDGLDGLPPLDRIWIDEGPKLAVSVEEVHTKSTEQVRIHGEKKGIMEWTSYPPEEDTDNFKWCRNFYKQCKILRPEPINGNFLPLNRMLPIYIGILESSKGTFNIYGKPDRVEALRREQIEVDKCKTPYELQARKRQYHQNEREGWDSGGAGAAYDNILSLLEQKVMLEEQYLHGAINYVEGNLEWTAGRMSPVRFVPLTHDEIMAGKVAKWRIYCTMEYLKENTNLCFQMPRKIKFIRQERHYLLQPPDHVIHVSGTDPVDYSRPSEMGVKKSKNASIVKDLQGNMISRYYARDEDPKDNIEDFIMQMIFFGTYDICEGNRKVAFTTLEDEGMYYFMLIRHVNGEIVPYAQNMKIKAISSSKDIIALYMSLIMKRIKNNIQSFKSPEVIQQHIDFDPQDTQKSDEAVADGLADIAVDALQTWVTTRKNKGGKYEGLGAATAALL